jgi:hypothetical protein
MELLQVTHQDCECTKNDLILSGHLPLQPHVSCMQELTDHIVIVC